MATCLVPLVATTLMVSGGAASPPPTPPPGETTVLYSWGREFRARYHDPLPCVAVPASALLPPPLFPQGLPPGARLASDGQRVMAVLLEDPARGFRLQLFKGGKLEKELFLNIPKSRPFVRPPILVLAPGGDPVALRDREGFAIYASGDLVGVFDGQPVAEILLQRDEVLWCPYPRAKWTRRGGEGAEPPPLCLRADLDGSDTRAVLRADSKRARRVIGDVFEVNDQAVAAVPRRDGTFWLAGLASGEIALASRSLTIERRFFLPYALRTEEDDPAAVQRLVHEFAAQADRVRGESPAHRDAARRPARNLGAAISPANRVFSFAAARDGALVLGTATEQPRKALLQVEDEQTVRCWQFPPGANAETGWLRAVVSTDGLWVLDPWAFVSWETLDHLWDEAFRPEPGAD
ncbi:MAG: hypothetical protein HRF46_03055 [Acidobacteriota bacterium]